MKEYIKEANDYLMHTYNRYEIILEKGMGVYLYDNLGNKYLDFGSGIAVFALGYGNQTYNDALKAQIDRLLHTSNYYYNEPAILAAKQFLKASNMDKVFFTNSGTEAIEGALKLAKKYYFNKHKTADGEIIAMNHSFHGRSLGALSVTGNYKYREAFLPMPLNTKFADFNNIESVKKAITDKTCAIIVEPIQGEGGIYEADANFLKELRLLCDEFDIVLIFDEIQCGMGRTGTMFSYEAYGVMPDIMTSAKALGCGVPVGAFAAKDKVAAAFTPGDHGSTYGGNPFVTSAINAVFTLFEQNQILENVKNLAPYLEEKLNDLVKEYDFIMERRGRGFIQGLECKIPVKDIVNNALNHGLILYSAGPNTLRFLPPLVINKTHIDEMIERLKKCF